MLSPDITPREQKKRGKENTKCALQDSFGTASFLQEKKKEEEEYYNHKDQCRERAIQEYNSKRSNVNEMVLQRKRTHPSLKI